MTDQDALFAALDEGLAALAAGTPLAQAQADLAARYPALAADLRELLEVAHAAGAGAPPAPPPARAQARSRAAMLGRAAALRQPRRRAWALFSLPFARVALIAVVFLGGFAAGTYGAVVASADALPGEALYAVKRTVENTELLLTGDEHARNQLEATFTERRLEEVRRLVSAGRPAAVEFTGWLSALDGEHWIVSNLPLTVPAGTPITGSPRPGVWVTVAGDVQPDRSVRATRVVVRSDDDVPLPTATPAASATAAASATPTLRPATATSTRTATLTPPPSATQSVAVGEDVEFTGVVESLGASAWQIGGQVVRVNAATEIRDNPQVGQVVEVRAVRQADGSLLATRIRAEDDGGDAGVGPSATNTPSSGGGSGPSPSNTPDSDDDGGDDGGGGGGSGPSPSNTPEPGDDDGDDDDNSGSGGGGQAATDTPEPDDDEEDDNSGGGGNSNSGPSPSNTPKPDEDDD